MNTYTVFEAQNENSMRQGTDIKASGLTAAKRKASSMQCFQKTVLAIYDGEHQLAAKKDGKWINS